jgi:hypothetical protein
VLDGELYSAGESMISPPTGPIRRGVDEEIIDAEIVEEA